MATTDDETPESIGPSAILLTDASSDALAGGVYTDSASDSDGRWDPTEDLRTASGAPSAVLELSLDGRVRYVSPTWETVAPTVPASRLVGTIMSRWLRGTEAEKGVFDRALREMEANSGSYTVWFSVAARSQEADIEFGLEPQTPDFPESLDHSQPRLTVGGVAANSAESEPVQSESTTSGIVNSSDESLFLEAQGILIRSTCGNQPSHTLWIVSRYVAEPALNIQLPRKLVTTPGFVTQIFAEFLEELAEAVRIGAPEVPAPPQELCRICERFIKQWWFERHHWLCYLKHKCEERVISVQEKLLDHREMLLHVLRPAPPGRPRVSSPLVPPLQSVLIDICDLALDLDIPDSEAPEPVSPESASILHRIGQLRWDGLAEPKKLVDETRSLVDAFAAAIDHMGSLVRFSMTLWREIEKEVRAAIEATVEAAEHGAAEIKIDYDFESDFLLTVPSYNNDASTASTLRGPQTDADFSDTEPIADDDDELELLRRLDSAHSVSPHASPRLTPSDSPRDSPRLSPRMSPRLSPRMSPRLSPRPWSSCSSGAATPTSYLAGTTSAGSATAPVNANMSPLLSAVGASSHISPMSSATPPHRRSITTTLTRNSLSLQRRLSSTTTASASSDDRPVQPTIRDYEVLKPISRGAYGIVYLVRKRLTGELFAIKVLSKLAMVAKNQVQQVRAERQVLMTTAASPFVATLYYSFQSQNWLYLVMEYVPGGDCAALLRKMGCFPEEWARVYIAELVLAADSLHAAGVLHRDLKPDNLLINAQGHIKLSDFGMSTAFRNRTTPLISGKEIGGTPDYLAPETVLGEAQSAATDWWAVGCILYEFLYGVPPFNDETPQLVISNVVEGRFEFPTLPREDDVSVEAKLLIKGLLRRDPCDRLDSEAIRNHPWMRSIDWGNLYRTHGPFVPHIVSPTSTEYFDDRGANALPPQNFDWESPDIEFVDDHHYKQQRRSSSISSTHSYSGPVLSGAGNSSASAAPGSGSGAVPSVPGALTASSPTLGCEDEQTQPQSFGSFSYRNLPVLEKANNEVITKIRAEPRESRRLSFSLTTTPPVQSPPSPASGATMVRSGTPRTPEDDDARSAALQRVRRRQQLRHSFCSPASPRGSFGTPPPGGIPQLSGGHHSDGSSMSPGPSRQSASDVLACSNDSVALAALERAFGNLGCRVVAGTSNDEAIRRAMGGVQFDLIALAPLPETAGVGVDDVVRVVRETLNPNQTTPILATVDCPGLTALLDITDEAVLTGQLSTALAEFTRHDLAPSSGSAATRASSAGSEHAIYLD